MANRFFRLQRRTPQVRPMELDFNTLAAPILQKQAKYDKTIQEGQAYQDALLKVDSLPGDDTDYVKQKRAEAETLMDYYTQTDLSNSRSKSKMIQDFKGILNDPALGKVQSHYNQYQKVQESIDKYRESKELVPQNLLDLQEWYETYTTPGSGGFAGGYGAPPSVSPYANPDKKFKELIGHLKGDKSQELTTLAGHAFLYGLESLDNSKIDPTIANSIHSLVNSPEGQQLVRDWEAEKRAGSDIELGDYIRGRFDAFGETLKYYKESGSFVPKYVDEGNKDNKPGTPSYDWRIQEYSVEEIAPYYKDILDGINKRWTPLGIRNERAGLPEGSIAESKFKLIAKGLGVNPDTPEGKDAVSEWITNRIEQKNIQVESAYDKTPYYQWDDGYADWTERRDYPKKVAAFYQDLNARRNVQKIWDVEEKEFVSIPEQVGTDDFKEQHLGLTAKLVPTNFLVDEISNHTADEQEALNYSYGTLITIGDKEYVVPAPEHYYKSFDGQVAIKTNKVFRNLARLPSNSEYSLKEFISEELDAKDDIKITQHTEMGIPYYTAKGRLYTRGGTPIEFDHTDPKDENRNIYSSLGELIGDIMYFKRTTEQISTPY